VRAAQAVAAMLVEETGGPAVMDHHPLITGNDANGLGRFATAFRMQALHRDRTRRVDMELMVLPVDAQGGLVNVHHQHGQALFNGVALPIFQGEMPWHDIFYYRRLRDRPADQGADRLRDPPEREPVRDEQVQRVCFDADAVLQRTGHVVGEGPAVRA